MKKIIYFIFFVISLTTNAINITLKQGESYTNNYVSKQLAAVIPNNTYRQNIIDKSLYINYSTNKVSVSTEVDPLLHIKFDYVKIDYSLTIDSIAPIGKYSFSVEYSLSNGGIGIQQTITVDFNITVIDLHTDIELDRNNNEINFQIYPNPVNTVCNLSFNIIKSSNTKIMLFDNQGRYIKEICNDKFKADKYNILIDVSDLSAGFYYIQFKTNSESSLKKLIISKN